MRRASVLLGLLLGASACNAARYDPNQEEGITLDRELDLGWQSAPDAGMSFAQAKAHCESLRLGGHADWRLPVTPRDWVEWGNTHKDGGYRDDGAFEQATVDGQFWTQSAVGNADVACVSSGGLHVDIRYRSEGPDEYGFACCKGLPCESPTDTTAALNVRCVRDQDGGGFGVY